MTPSRQSSRPASLFSGVAILVCAAPSLGQMSFHPLGFPPGATSSRARAISGDGRTIAGDLGTSSAQPWWWTSATGMAFIPNATGSARGITPDGSVIVGEASSLFAQGFRYFPATNTTIRFPNFGGVSYTQGYGLSADGTYIAALLVTPPSGRTPARWSEAGPEFPSENGGATAISADGSVVAGYTFNIGSATGSAFRWTPPGGVVLLGHVAPVPPRPSGGANAMTPDGSVIVGWCGDGTTGQRLHAFRWSQATGIVGLGAVGGAETLSANAVTADGSVIVGSYAGGRAFIWDAPSGARDLRDLLLASGAGAGLQAWTLQSAQGISADGNTVVGYGLDGQGRTQAFLARLVSAPCYANCDGSTLQPVLNVLDFNCFLSRFAAADPYANCDQSTQPPVLTADDFVCFQSRFAAGCP